MRLSNLEVRCINLFAQWFNENPRRHFERQKVLEELEITQEEYEPVMQVLADLGYIDPHYSDAEFAPIFRIDSFILQAAREIYADEIERKEPQDIVVQVKAWARRNPWTAWPIIVVLLIGFLATVASAVLNLLERFGILV